jgi:hypothetical protein
MLGAVFQALRARLPSSVPAGQNATAHGIVAATEVAPFSLVSACPRVLSLKGDTHTSGYTLRIVVSTGELTVIINVGRNAIVP